MRSNNITENCWKNCIRNQGVCIYLEITEKRKGLLASFQKEREKDVENSPCKPLRKVVIICRSYRRSHYMIAATEIEKERTAQVIARIRGTYMKCGRYHLGLLQIKCYQVEIIPRKSQMIFILSGRSHSPSSHFLMYQQ